MGGARGTGPTDFDPGPEQGRMVQWPGPQDDETLTGPDCSVVLVHRGGAVDGPQGADPIDLSPVNEKGRRLAQPQIRPAHRGNPLSLRSSRRGGPLDLEPGTRAARWRDTTRIQTKVQLAASVTRMTAAQRAPTQDPTTQAVEPARKASWDSDDECLTWLYCGPRRCSERRDGRSTGDADSALPRPGVLFELPKKKHN